MRSLNNDNNSSNRKPSKVLYTSKDETGEIVWRNPATCVMSKVEVHIPYQILAMMISLERRISNSKLEYGVYIKGEFDDEGKLIVGTDVMIPNQKVTNVSIDFLEDDKNQFNGVMHRHPAGMKSFSGTDKESINQNYTFSLLYTDKDICTGIVNLEVCHGYGKVQLPAEIHIMYDEIEISDEDVAKIQEHKIENVVGGKFVSNGRYFPTNLYSRQTKSQLDLQDLLGSDALIEEQEEEEEFDEIENLDDLKLLCENIGIDTTCLSNSDLKMTAECLGYIF